MRTWIIVGIALGVGGLFGCVDTDPSQTPTAIEVPLQRTPGGGVDLAPARPDIRNETIERAPPEPGKPIPFRPQP
ncbi:MAG: hypothetical protein WBV82_14785 [Myxococcaceae bacterium]